MGINKRGVEAAFNLILLLIPAIIYVIASLTFQGKIASAADELAKDAICSSTLKDNANLRVPILNAQTPKGADYKCPTKYITIYENKVEKEYDDYKPDDKPIVQKFDEDCTKYSKKGQLTKYKHCVFRNSNKFIAKEMVSCWDKFHQGRLSLFSTYTEETQCLVCSVIYFDSPIQERFGGSYVGWEYSSEPDISLDAYMRLNSPLQGHAGKSDMGDLTQSGEESGAQSYYTYTLDLIDKYVEQPYYDYDPGQDYAIVLTALNQDRIGAIAENIKDLLIGVHDPRGEFINTMTFIENEQVTTICETIV